MAEFDYSPTKCEKTYRVVVVWKDLEVTQGPAASCSTPSDCFFYITNDWESSAAEIVFTANDRCNQENLIEQHKNGVHALDGAAGQPGQQLGLHGDGLAGLEPEGLVGAAASRTTGAGKRSTSEEKRRLLRMDFATFRNALINIPAQIVRTGRQIVYRLLAWNPWQDGLLPPAGRTRPAAALLTTPP